MVARAMGRGLKARERVYLQGIEASASISRTITWTISFQLSDVAAISLGDMIQRSSYYEMLS
jgi:hypothetical protein